MSSARPRDRDRKTGRGGGGQPEGCTYSKQAREALLALRNIKQESQKDSRTGKAMAVHTQTDKLTNDS